jgi:hypothetical protein
MTAATALPLTAPERPPPPPATKSVKVGGVAYIALISQMSCGFVAGEQKRPPLGQKDRAGLPDTKQ